ncbi:oxidoreductase [Sphaerisporangium rhizosphaerae]|uniref:NADH:flavin oxidoreductase/NADH oxidase N-terminal domain-containing protein n=1 Tax=Sphaerisporangium rhizosphaerae TaxID=2269375 RepID=A0ABW2P0L1_9ACTN
MIFEPFTIGDVTFNNRVIRSSIGGRTAYYDGTVSNAWKNFELRFARNGVAAIVSATLNVNPMRWSPLEYPQISHDKFITHLREAIHAIHAEGCKYVIQIGDGGSHVQTSLFSQPQDGYGPSSGFDLLFGYRTRRTEMTLADIEQTVHEFGQAARRVRETGADGVEITASKGYLIHQFLNPAINRRRDRYGGSVERRFQLLREVIGAVRRQVGDDFMVGVRISAWDRNYLPIDIRWPVTRPLRAFLRGNDIDTYLRYGRWLRDLGVDYLHVSNGYGFINPGETPGRFPVDEVRQFANSTRHLSAKAAVRATILNVVPKMLLDRVLGIGWTTGEAANLRDAQRFRQEVGLPVIANGGFQRRSLVEEALESGACDLISMARPLLANPDLVEVFRQGGEAPARPCTFCNRCAIRTTLFPLGCYEPLRFDSDAEMEAQILDWSARPDVTEPLPWDPSGPAIPSPAGSGDARRAGHLGGV